MEVLLRLPKFLACAKSVSEDPSGTGLSAPDLPRRLFRDLRPRVRRGVTVPWSEEDNPLPFFRYLFDLYHSRRVVVRPPSFGAREGYALTKAVAAGFAPLVKFLLGNGADPEAKGAIAVMVAIQKKDLQMVKLLMEGNSGDSGGAKRRRVPDRIACTNAMVRRAVAAGAQDVVRYLLGKEVAIDMQTLQLLFSSGYR